MPSCTGTSRSSPCRAIPSPVCEDDGIAFCQVFVNEAQLERELQLESLCLALHWSRSQTAGSGRETSLAHAHNYTNDYLHKDNT